jgi:hypothetical protein
MAPPQGRGPAGAPIGVVYNTAMSRPDAALALAALAALSNRREARVGAVCVSGAGLGAAIYCDLVYRFYAPANRSSNSLLPVGLAASRSLPPDPPMVRTAIERKDDAGEPAYARTIRGVSDTSLAEAVLRNGVIMTAESVMVLSAPATWLARSLDLLGAKDQYRQRVKRLVIVQSAEVAADMGALGKIAAEWPTPVFFCGEEVGSALAFPASAVEEAFGWAPAHPVADAYRAFKPMPYDAPAHDVMAMLYAVHPDAGFFQVSDAGSLMLSVAGTSTSRLQGVGFDPDRPGNVRKISVDPAGRAAALKLLIDLVGSKPPAPPAGRGRG